MTEGLFIPSTQTGCFGNTGQANLSKAPRYAAPTTQKASYGCCQTNSNQSLQGQLSCPLCHAHLTPLCQSGGPVQLEIAPRV
jgi:hypothetical protein